MSSTLEGVALISRPALREQIQDLRHDLGKYMVFQLRWLAPEPSDDELREALVTDLARTRAAGDKVETAAQLWARLRPPLVGEVELSDGTIANIGDDPDLLAIDEALALITDLIPRLDDASREQLEAGKRAAMDAAAATRRLQKRARAL